MPTTTNYGWTTPADTDLVKDGASAIRTLGTAIDTTVFNNASAGIAKTIVDAKGDIIAATAADTVSRLAVGANDTILTADSTTATGLKWAAPATAGGLTLISETVASNLSSLSLSSIPSTYKQLFLEWEGIYHSNNDSSFNIRFNNVSTESYWGNLVTGSDSTLTQAAMASVVASPIPAFGKGVNLNPTAEFYFNCRGSLMIDNYASSTKTKKYKLGCQYYDNSATSKYRTQIIQDSYFSSTSAITSIDIVRTAGTGTFSNITNSTIRLYGLA
jgi:hypothetical protein